MWMRMQGQVRGSRFELRWDDGRLDGDPEIIRRVLRYLRRQGDDVSDPLAAVRGVELALGERVKIEVGENRPDDATLDGPSQAVEAARPEATTVEPADPEPPTASAEAPEHNPFPPDSSR